MIMELNYEGFIVKEKVLKFWKLFLILKQQEKINLMPIIMNLCFLEWLTQECG